MEFRREQIEVQLSTQVCLLVYDQECRLCVSAKQKLEELGIGRTESDMRFLAYQSEAAKRTLGSNYRPGRPSAAFLIRPSGEVLQGLEAFLPFAPSLPGGKLLRWCLRFSSAKRLAEWGYRMVARHRYQWFGEVDSLNRRD
jgi:predicted DCC family thiol-disulfide oxidoreductase YuxK